MNSSAISDGQILCGLSALNAPRVFRSTPSILIWRLCRMPFFVIFAFAVGVLRAGIFLVWLRWGAQKKIYIHIYILTHISFVRGPLEVKKRTRAHTRTHTHMHTRKHAHRHTHTHIHTCVRETRMYTKAHTHTHTHTRTHTHKPEP